LHTVLEHPTREQFDVLVRLIARSDRLVVMSGTARRILETTWRAPGEKIAVVPHGVPEARLGRARKAALGLDGAEVLLTFGLLSPDKGLEAIIEAMPQILLSHPDAVFVILGVTHPNQVRHEGERYREFLKTLAISLGVSDRVLFRNFYLPTEELLDFINAADICVFPYRNPIQTTSGTLAYAAGMGKAIIATPFTHAREVLGEDRGVVVAFEDSAAMGAAVIDLLDDLPRAADMGRRVNRFMREDAWPRVAVGYLRVFETSIRSACERRYA
jgi:glycosyltransferase involved in cell wall biosynthesis